MRLRGKLKHQDNKKEELMKERESILMELGNSNKI